MSLIFGAFWHWQLCTASIKEVCEMSPWCLRTVDRAVTCYSCSEQCFLHGCCCQINTVLNNAIYKILKENSFFRHFSHCAKSWENQMFLTLTKIFLKLCNSDLSLWCKCILFLLVGCASNKDYWLRMGTCLRVALPQLNYITYKTCFSFSFLKLKNLVIMHVESFLVLFKAPLFSFSLFLCLDLLPLLLLKALEYLFKFIVQSRILYSRATCGMEEEQFRSSIQELFQSIRFVLSLDSRSSETLIFTQVCYFLHSHWQTTRQLFLLG